jgi:hypothetical protein
VSFAVLRWRYYQGPKVLPELAIGERLSLRMDSLNPWDAYAVEILDKHGIKLGFIPREFSRAVYNHLSNDLPLKSAIIGIEPSAEYRPVTIRIEAPVEAEA